MTKRHAKTPPGEAFVKLPRRVLESTAWRGLGINARRVVDFLMLEHLRHGGQHNGGLKAPHRQLVAFGIGARHVAGAIAEAEEAGLIEIQKSALPSGGRPASPSEGRLAKSALPSEGRSA